MYGLVLIQANYEATLGQILIALGYKLDVGQAQNNWNPNTSMMAANLPGVEAGTDEVAAPHFVKAGERQRDDDAGGALLAAGRASVTAGIREPARRR